MTDHDHFNESAGAYVLGALPEREHDEFETHLAACAVCRDEVEELRVASDALPDAVPQVAPAPELRGRIMAIVEREAELLQAAGPEADRATPPPRRRWSWPSLRIAVPALACAAAVGVGVGIAVDGPGTRTQLAQIAPRIPGAHAQLRISGDSAELVADHIPAPPMGRIYQVWLQRKGQTKPEPTTALFSVTGDGRAAVDVPGSMKDVKRVMVTDEPLGGSSQPTGELLLSATPA